MQTIAPVRPLIPTTPVESSSIAAVGYNPATRVLQVNFKGKPGEDPRGKPYQYDNFPNEKWEAMNKAESVGSFINKEVVRGGYASTKMAWPK